jgi:hypothetical protein
MFARHHRAAHAVQNDRRLAGTDGLDDAGPDATQIGLKVRPGSVIGCDSVEQRKVLYRLNKAIDELRSAGGVSSVIVASPRYPRRRRANLRLIPSTRGRLYAASGASRERN